MLRTERIVKKYGSGHTELTVLDGLDFQCERSEVVGIFGSSGSGKSTFLHIIGGLDAPSSGTVFFDGTDIYSLDEKDLAGFRNRTVGFVFQFYHLLPEFCAVENVMIPCLIGGAGKKEATERAKDALQRVQLTERFSNRPSELSGGEQQRVAIARAIVMKPEILLADEPTGNLDSDSGRRIMDLLLGLRERERMGIVMVTHDQTLSGRMDRKLKLEHGKL